MANSVEVTSTGQVVVTEVAEQAIELTTAAQPLVVEVQTAGPQGPQGPPVAALNDIGDVDAAAPVNNSVLYFDTATGSWRGNDVNTITTITDGGNY
jgi:hypothetical protein